MSGDSTLLEERPESSESQLAEESVPDIHSDTEIIEQATKEAEEELSELYGFDFQQIAARNDELLRENPRNDIKSDLKKRDRYNHILEMSDKVRPYTPEMALGSMLLAGVIEGTEPALGEYSATLAVGGLACAALYGVSHLLQVGDRVSEPSGYKILEENSALEYIEEMDSLRVDGEVPYTFSTGEEVSTDLEDLTNNGETVAVARSYDDGKKEITLLQDNYPEEESAPEFHSYTVSGFSDLPLPEGQPSEENWNKLRRTVDAGEYIEFDETGWPTLT